MSFKKSDYYTVVEQTKEIVPGFKDACHQFIERTAIEQKSKSLIGNYLRCGAHVALHFGTVSADEINSECFYCAQRKTYRQEITRRMGFDIETCPSCNTGKMHTIACFGPNAPPKTCSLLNQ